MKKSEIILEVESWIKVFEFLEETANKKAVDYERDQESRYIHSASASAYKDAVNAFNALLKKIRS